MIEWKSVPGYEEEYQISNTGLIKSLARVVKSNSTNHWYTKSEKLLKPEIMNSGYYRVQLLKNGIINRFLVHRLVAKVFIPNPLDKPEVNHKDGNKLNNHVENLEWVTISENKKHALATGLRNPKLAATYIPENIRFLIKKEYIKGSKLHGCIALGLKYNIGKQSVLNIVKEL